MKNFEYAAPCSENEVLQLLSAQPGQTELLAGGTDLVGLMKKMIVTPELCPKAGLIHGLLFH